jgi:DNA-binding transcriptional regulator YdaS (Cro superfamily)
MMVDAAQALAGGRAGGGRRAWTLNLLLITAMLVGVHIQAQAPERVDRPDCRFAGELVPDQRAAPGEGDEPREMGAAHHGGESPYAPLARPESWRIGFGIASAADAAYWGPALGAGWYIDWAVARRPGYLEPEHWQMVRIAQGCTSIAPERAAEIARRYPGGTWIIGNEPDVIWQDNVRPERYARAYHDFYSAIKTADPNAQVAVAGVSQATPLRMAYLDRVLDTYAREFGAAMPVDLWTVHGFVLREERGNWGVDIPPGMEAERGRLYEVEDHGSLALFESHLRAFREWMAVRGYQDVPLAVTEFGILMYPEHGYTSEITSEYLRRSFSLLASMRDRATGYPQDDYRLVQRWAWFSLSDPHYPTGDLADLESRLLTSVGHAFRGYVEGLPR